jgi:hypothetical protein
VKLTKRQKISFAIFAVAIAALVVDRAFLGGGSIPAGASASSSPPPVTDTPPASPPADVNVPSSTIRLNQRLETLWLERVRDINQPRDVFTLAETWANDIFPKEPETTPEPEKNAVTVFQTNHQLQAVVISDHMRCVTVNGRVLELGDELDGFKLIFIEEDAATFETGKSHVTLTMTNDR